MLARGDYSDAVRVRIGTSGYSYKEWKGHFYPDDLPASKMLGYYAERFDTVEINNTFYRMPDATTVEKWATQVPDGFTFVLKAPQRITHQKRLANAEDDVAHLFEVGSTLGEKLGPVLFQLPPYSRKDAGKLKEFVEWLPEGRKVAFEFRHESWCDDEIYAILRARDIPLCLSDTDEADAQVMPTAGWGYLRLRKTEYSHDALAEWATRVSAQPWTDAYVFFKHEDEAKGPAFAQKFRALLN